MYFSPAKTGQTIPAQSTARIMYVVLVGIIFDLDKVNVFSILERKNIRIFVVFVNATTIAGSRGSMIDVYPQEHVFQSTRENSNSHRTFCETSLAISQTRLLA
jgi:hypothetical protein